MINTLSIIGAKYLFIVIAGIAFVYFLRLPRAEQKRLGRDRSFYHWSRRATTGEHVNMDFCSHGTFEVRPRCMLSLHPRERDDSTKPLKVRALTARPSQFYEIG